MQQVLNKNPRCFYDLTFFWCCRTCHEMMSMPGTPGGNFASLKLRDRSVGSGSPLFRFTQVRGNNFGPVTDPHSGRRERKDFPRLHRCCEIEQVGSRNLKPAAQFRRNSRKAFRQREIVCDMRRAQLMAFGTNSHRLCGTTQFWQNALGVNDSAKAAVKWLQPGIQGGDEDVFGLPSTMRLEV